MKPAIDQVKIFGERHTATNALTQFVNQNFNVSCLGNNFLGWKHRRAPLRSEWSKTNYLNTLFIFTVREPGSWLRAMGKQTWNCQQPETYHLPFTVLLTYPFEEYESIIHMWNEKHLSFIKMAEEVPHAIFIKTEDFSADQQSIYNQLAQYLQRKESFQPLNEYLRGIESDPNLPPKAYPSFNQHDLIIINDNLNKKLCAYFGYPQTFT